MTMYNKCTKIEHIDRKNKKIKKKTIKRVESKSII